ncbi:MAG: hypothetical protein K0R67_2326 [Paenibacillus sp.]|nr:hypothetical protein [Paenibacillus sp.]
MAKADNMLSVLWLLKSGRRRTAKELAEALEMNIRTVYRYIDALCASGVPIISDSGHNGGYSLLHTFKEAPLVFDAREQKALVHAALFAQEAGYPFGEDLDRAVSKLKMYTNEDQLEAINRHTRGFDVIHVPADDRMIAFLQELEQSVADGHTLSMEYQKGYDSVSQTRSINPYGLVYWKGKWYIVAYCHLRTEIRSFRVDRIHGLSRIGDTFQAPEDFSARDFFLKFLLPDVSDKEQLISVRIQGKLHAIQDLCSHWLFGHVLVERSDHEVHLKLDVHALESVIPHFLLSYGRAVQILEPLSLKQKVASIAADILRHHEL